MKSYSITSTISQQFAGNSDNDYKIIHIFDQHQHCVEIDVHGHVTSMIHDVKSDQDNLLEIIYKIRVHDGASFEMMIALLHQNECNIDIDIQMLGVKANSEVFVVYGLCKNQTLRISTAQRHVVASSKSSVVVRGVGKDSSYVSYNGLIYIAQDCPATYATQQHTSLVLDRSSRVISVPAIEVLCHDVQCLHASAIGKFQKEHEYYLQQKGFNREQIYGMLLHSFFAQYTNRFLKFYNVLETLCQKIT